MTKAKANIGSLSKMASKVRQEKGGAKSSTAATRDSQNYKFKSAATVQDSSSSDSDSSTSSNGGSDSDVDLAAMRDQLLSRKKAKQEKAAATKSKPPTKLNGAPTTTPAKPSANGSPPTSAQKPTNDSDSDSDSSSTSSSDSDSEPTAKPAPASATGAETSNASGKGAPESSDSDSSSESDSDSDSDSDDNDRVPTAGAKLDPKPQAVNGHPTLDEDSDSGSESDDEGDGGNAIVEANAAGQAATPITRPSWLNNSEFTLRKALSDNPGKEVSDFLSRTNLEGKQVWYFTAPASLPITVLKDMEIDLAKAMSGKPLLTHNGDNYGLDMEADATSTQIQLLIPSRAGNEYTPVNRGIDSTVHVRRMAKFGPDGEVQSTAGEGYVPMPKPIRQQPEGLRTRFTPIGVPRPAMTRPTPSQMMTSTPVNAPRALAQAKAPASSSSSSGSESESESESDSDTEMTTAPTSATQAEPSHINGALKRKHSGDASQGSKRLKAVETPQQATAAKSTPVRPPVPGLTSTTPSRVQISKTTAKKDKPGKDKTPKQTITPSIAAKQTPVPIPSYPGMKR